MTGQLVSRSRLTTGQRAAMLALLDAHFEGVGEQAFARDLAEKNWVILLEDETRRLRGFSTMLVYQAQAAGEPVRVVYSGDTIIDREAWGSPALARSWIGAVDRLRAQPGSDERWFWLLLTSGFRTYRFLPVFWREFVPSHCVARHSPLLAQLARERFGDGYDEASGIVRLAAPQVLRGELRQVPPGRREDPHVRFFEARNPGWREGDELVCLCELSDDNLTPAGRRVVAAARREAQGLPGPVEPTQPSWDKR
jgi:hypothetical protein